MIVMMDVYEYIFMCVQLYIDTYAGVGGSQSSTSDIFLGCSLHFKISMCVCWGMHICEYRLQWNPEEYNESPGVGVTVAYGC